MKNIIGLGLYRAMYEALDKLVVHLRIVAFLPLKQKPNYQTAATVLGVVNAAEKPFFSLQASTH